MTLGELATLRQSVSGFTRAADLEQKLHRDNKLDSFLVNHHNQTALLDRAQFFEALTSGSSLRLAFRRRQPVSAMFADELERSHVHDADENALEVGLSIMEGGQTEADLLVRFENGRFGTVAVVDLLRVVASSHEEQHAEIAGKERRLGALLGETSDAVLVAGPDGRITYVSPAYTNITGLPLDDVIGVDGYERVHPEDVGPLQAAVERTVSDTSQRLSTEIRVQHVDGSWRWCHLAGRAMFDDPAIAGYITSIRDITEARALREGLRHQAEHDALTGLPNRQRFFTRLKELQSGGGERQGDGLERIVGIAYFDLDGFKGINDNLGHAAGDELLAKLADRLAPLIRSGDLIARLGGDEFAVLVGATSPEVMLAVVNRLDEAVRQPVEVGGELVTIGASFGVATTACGAVDSVELLRRADSAMYSSKRSRSTVTVWSAELDDPALAG